MKEKYEKIVPDTSVIIEGLLSAKIRDGKIRADTVIIHEAVLAELEHQANLNKALGFLGIDEIKRIKQLSVKDGFEIRFAGKKPSAAEIKYASLGEIDYIIRELAIEEDAVLMTADKIQAQIAEAKGVRLIYEKIEALHKKLLLEDFFDETTMSAHLRENVPPFAKKGMPGNWQFIKVREKILAREEVQDISREIIEEAGVRKDAFIEIERPGSTIVQLGKFRIVITKPPFSDGWEITAVRPVKKLGLGDYKLSEKLSKRIEEQAEGILVAGAPGMGKCHGKGTPILMYRGQIKMVEDIRAGDLIMGPDSKPRKVLSTTKGYGKLYRVKPVKGDPYIVNENHILSLKYSTSKIEKTTNISVKDFLNSPPHIKERCKGYRTGIEFPKKETPISPYFLGIWLGDGLSASLRISNSEIEILSFLDDYAQENGLMLKQHSYKMGTTCQTYGLTVGHRGGVVINPLLNKMKALNIMQNKHIPDLYKINDYGTRLEILSGLIDTDGYLYANCFEIATKFEKLKDDILYLARSVGFAAYSNDKYVKNRKYYRIRISGDISKIPTRIKRKRGHAREQVKNVLRTGIKVEDIGYGDYYGFELDKDGLYCLGDFTVTHNSTFAQALAEFYAGKDKIVKTVEAPRDLVLPDNVTQYAISHGDAQEIHDILLLSRPDYTIFDEMRNTDDFKLFADLRLAGIGLAGVVHATNPIDAIQRFVGRIELGVIPQVIDTVIFIKNGAVFKVLSLNMTVKVPSGMTEADLARPVVVVNDFETQKLEYELYSYGEETVVVPVRGEQQAKPAHKLAAKSIEQEFRNYTANPKVEMLSDNKCAVYVAENDIARIIGKQGQNINGIEEKLGLSIEIRDIMDKPRGSDSQEAHEGLEYEVKIMKKGVVFQLGHEAINKDVDVFVAGDYLLTAKVGKTGIIKVHKNNKIGRILVDAVNFGEKIKLVAK
ncbi:MAG: ATPase [archaeon GW2011_AR3]|nr:MAG: ATPase [archaeon GW2011_AR3]MBS3108985.1 hypothetical protein [Candidatus Woesearchaeota archaeon]